MRNDIRPVSRLQPYSWADLENLPRRPSLIKGLLDQKSLSVIYGPSNCGKTFLALDIAFHIAQGSPWLGAKVRSGSIVYIATEGGFGIRNRLTALRVHYAPQELPPLYIIPAGINLVGQSVDMHELIQVIRELPNVQIIIVDTLSRAMAGANENGPEDMGRFIQNCDQIRQQTSAHIMLIHHSGKDAERGARGHSALKAAVDTEIEVKKEGDLITAIVKKQRDGETGKEMYFNLKAVEVGVDEEGDKEWSCVLIPASNPPKKAKKLSRNLNRARDVLRDTMVDQGVMQRPKRDMAEVPCITKAAAKAALRSANITTSDKEENIERVIRKILDELNDRKITATYNDFIWLLDKTD